MVQLFKVDSFMEHKELIFHLKESQFRMINRDVFILNIVIKKEKKREGKNRVSIAATSNLEN